MIKAPHNYIFVEVESKFNDEITTKSGSKLFVTTSSYTFDDENTTANYKPSMIQRHYGTVVGVPLRLTEEVKIRQVDPGQPQPSPDSGYEYQWKTLADFEPEVQEGDKIYFDYKTVLPENEVPYVGKNIYKLLYYNAICVVRSGVTVTYENTQIAKNKITGDSITMHNPIHSEPFSTIIPLAGHVLVEPLWEEGVEDLGNGKRGKITKSGIVSELHDKPEPLRGRVAFVGSPMKEESTDIEQGDKVIYLPHADFEVEIEGKTYYAMRYWEIIGKIID